MNQPDRCEPAGSNHGGRPQRVSANPVQPRMAGHVKLVMYSDSTVDRNSAVSVAGQPTGKPHASVAGTDVAQTRCNYRDMSAVT